MVPDGTVRDEFRLARGWWEAKDTTDQLAAEIQKKLKAGYPARNTIFEDTQVAVLYQDRGEAGGSSQLNEPLKVADLLNLRRAGDLNQRVGRALLQVAQEVDHILNRQTPGGQSL